MTGVRTAAIEAWPLAARMASAMGSSTNAWRVVVAEPGSEVDAADVLVVELRSLVDDAIRRVSIYSAVELIEAAEADRDDVLVLSLESQWTDQDWRSIDVQRSRLMRKGMTILAVGDDDVAAMVTAAPNLWSWVGGEVWALRLEEGRDG